MKEKNTDITWKRFITFQKAHFLKISYKPCNKCIFNALDQSKKSLATKQSINSSMRQPRSKVVYS